MLPGWLHHYLVEKKFCDWGKINRHFRDKFEYLLDDDGIGSYTYNRRSKINDKIRMGLYLLLTEENIHTEDEQRIINKLVRIRRDQRRHYMNVEDVKTLLKVMARSQADKKYKTWLIQEVYRVTEVYFLQHLQWITSDKRKRESKSNSENETIKIIKDGMDFLSNIRNLNCHYNPEGSLSPFQNNNEKKRFRDLCEKTLRYLITLVHPNNVEEIVSTENFTVF